MEINYAHLTSEILADYAPGKPEMSAAALRSLWLQADPGKQAVGLTAEAREALEAVGVPVPVLTEIGKAIGKAASKRVNDFMPLVHCLWDSHGREGRIVSVHALGPMELADPDVIVPLVYALARTCLAWEDCDNLAMRALEPIVRKKPAEWLQRIEPWLADENKWVRRAFITVVARLPMADAAYLPRCLELTERLLLDDDQDVRRAVSFAIRIGAKEDAALVCDFLAQHIPPANCASTWVLCDAIRSMGKAILPAFLPLLPAYERWAADPALGSQDRKSIESAIKTLMGAKT